LSLLHIGFQGGGSFLVKRDKGIKGNIYSDGNYF